MRIIKLTVVSKEYSRVYILGEDGIVDISQIESEAGTYHRITYDNERASIIFPNVPIIVDLA